MRGQDIEMEVAVFLEETLAEQTRTIRYSLAVKERELGNALILPPNREIDVVTGVVMAGYIDPIDSPTTVTVYATVVSSRVNV